MNGMKTQWHPGFVCAVKLELSEYMKFLDFNDTYTLNQAPLELDLLIIKKEPSVQISNDIGSFFRGHNILEFKSPPHGVTTSPAGGMFIKALPGRDCNSA